jgi:hypothetical protein
LIDEYVLKPDDIIRWVSVPITNTQLEERKGMAVNKKGAAKLKTARFENTKQAALLQHAVISRLGLIHVPFSKREGRIVSKVDPVSLSLRPDGHRLTPLARKAR